MNRVAPRFLIAVAVTVVALIAVAILSLVGGDDDTGSRTSTTVAAPGTTTMLAGPETTTTLVEIPEDWYPKGSSRYSDREPSGSAPTQKPVSEEPSRP